MHTLAPNNSIVRLESLRGEENRRPEALNMRREVEDEVEFRFVEPTWRPANNTIEEFSDRSFKTGLEISICET